MHSVTIKFPRLGRVFTTLKVTEAVTISRSLCTVTESRTQKLERISDELLDLTKLERYDFATLLGCKLGLDRFGPVVPAFPSSGPAASGSTSAETKAAEKTAFDVKLEKYDQAAKIKIIKEVKTFTGLGLKESKDLVEKAPAVIKKGVTKEEADKIVEKLKELNAIVVLE